MARLEREAEERNKQRQQEEHEQIKRRHVKERLDELRKTPQGSKILQNIDEEVFQTKIGNNPYNYKTLR